MSTLMGFAIGVVAMAILMGFCAAIASVTYSNPDTIPLYAGIAAGVVLVLAVVAYTA